MGWKKLGSRGDWASPRNVTLQILVSLIRSQRQSQPSLRFLGYAFEYFLAHWLPHFSARALSKGQCIMGNVHRCMKLDALGYAAGELPWPF